MGVRTVKCPRCHGYVFTTEDCWGTALRCLHCGWERDITCRVAVVNGATPLIMDGERPPPLWEMYCTAFPWEDWVRLALSGRTYERRAHGESRLRLRGPGPKGG